jgi:hypothetical protein
MRKSKKKTSEGVSTKHVFEVPFANFINGKFFLECSNEGFPFYKQSLVKKERNNTTTLHQGFFPSPKNENKKK